MSENAKKSWHQRLGWLAVWMVGGAVVGYFAGGWIGDNMGGGERSIIHWSELAAFVVAIVYLVAALIVTIGVLWPRWGIKHFNDDEVDEYERARPLIAVSGICCAAYGISLLAAALYEPLGIAPFWAAVLFFGLMIGSTALFWPKRHLMDELDWRVTNEATVVTYYALLAIGGSWSALAQFGLVAGPQMLDWLTMFWGFLLVGSMAALGRRGML